MNRHQISDLVGGVFCGCAHNNVREVLRAVSDDDGNADEGDPTPAFEFSRRLFQFVNRLVN